MYIVIITFNRETVETLSLMFPPPCVHTIIGLTKEQQQKKIK